MSLMRGFVCLLACSAFLLNAGCSSDKPAEPKVSGPVDPNIKRAGREGGGGAGGPAKNAGGQMTQPVDVK